MFHVVGLPLPRNPMIQIHRHIDREGKQYGTLLLLRGDSIFKLPSAGTPRSREDPECHAFQSSKLKLEGSLLLRPGFPKKLARRLCRQFVSRNCCRYELIG